MGKGASGQIIGYWYAVGMHMVVCNEGVDEVTEIDVGDKVAWVGSITQNERIYINEPNLFGGENSEGGIQGYVDMMFGTPDQPCNDYLVDRIGGGPSVGDPNPPTLSDAATVNPDGTVTLPDGTIVPEYEFGEGEPGAIWDFDIEFYGGDPNAEIIPAVGQSQQIQFADDTPPPNGTTFYLTDRNNFLWFGSVTSYQSDNQAASVVPQILMIGNAGDPVASGTPVTMISVPEPSFTGMLLAAAGGPLMSKTTGNVNIGAQGTQLAIPLENSGGFPIGNFMILTDGTRAIIGHVQANAANIATIQLDDIYRGTVGDIIHTGAIAIYYEYPGSDVVTGVAGQSGFIPAFRGVMSFVLRQVWVSALTAYIKPWAFRVRRSPKALSDDSRTIIINYQTTYTEFTGLTTSDVVAGVEGNTTTTITTDSLGNKVITQTTNNPNGITIVAITTNGTTVTTATGLIKAANPAALIAECLLNTSWGMGFPTSQVNTDVFESVATTLAAEGFGLCVAWTDQTRMEDFINQILKTINAVRYEEPDTGRIGIRLIRADYDVDTIQVLDETNVVEVTSLIRPDPSDIINQVTINFIDRSTSVNRAITAHNGASINLNSGVNPTTIDYPAIPTLDLAKRVALRELGTYSRGAAGVKLVMNRDGQLLKAGDVVKLNWAALNVFGMILRIAEADYGLLTDNRITLNALEDSFAFPATSYLGGTNSGWVDPNAATRPINIAKLFEVPYYIFQTEIASDLDSSTILPDGYAFFGAVAARPQSIGTGYSVYENSSGNYVDILDASYTPYGSLQTEVDDVEDTFQVLMQDLTGLKLNSYAFLDDEIVAITGIIGTTVSVLRGVLDTVPVAHSSGATLWFAGGARAIKEQIYLAGQSLTAKLQAQTPTAAIPLSNITARTLTLVGRAEMPYPPGNIRVDSVYRPAGPVGLGEIEWSHRNRLTQTGGFVSQTTGDITPEVGTTYTVNIYQRMLSTDPWVLAQTASGITGNTFTPSGVIGKLLRIEISSQRDGLSSYQTQILETARLYGFGLNFGRTFGA